MGNYSKTGSYAGYDRNNKERESLDYYATPVKEVENILQVLNFTNLEDCSILEPCCGGGHMVEGIIKSISAANIVATDIKERPNIFLSSHLEKGVKYMCGQEYDFLSDNYPISSADIVMMNPPFKVIIPFILHGLDIAKKYLVCFGRTKTIEGIERYNKIFSKVPPTAMYQYIDRVACGKNGKFENNKGIEAHAWFIWDIEEMQNSPNYETKLRWLHTL